MPARSPRHVFVWFASLCLASAWALAGCDTPAVERCPDGKEWQGDTCTWMQREDCPPGEVGFVGRATCTPVGARVCSPGTERDPETGVCTLHLPERRCPDDMLLLPSVGKCAPISACTPLDPTAFDVWVDPTLPPDDQHAPTVAEAIAQLPDGGTIGLADGTHVVDAVVDADIHIMGRCPTHTRLMHRADVMFDVSTPAFHLENVTLETPTGTAVLARFGETTLSSVVVQTPSNASLIAVGASAAMRIQRMRLQVPNELFVDGVGAPIAIGSGAQLYVDGLDARFRGRGIEVHDNTSHAEIQDALVRGSGTIPSALVNHRQLGIFYASGGTLEARDVVSTGTQPTVFADSGATIDLRRIYISKRGGAISALNIVNAELLLSDTTVAAVGSALNLSGPYSQLDIRHSTFDSISDGTYEASVRLFDYAHARFYRTTIRSAQAPFSGECASAFNEDFSNINDIDTTACALTLQDVHFDGHALGSGPRVIWTSTLHANAVHVERTVKTGFAIQTRHADITQLSVSNVTSASNETGTGLSVFGGGTFNMSQSILQRTSGSALHVENRWAFLSPTPGVRMHLDDTLIRDSLIGLSTGADVVVSSEPLDDVGLYATQDVLFSNNLLRTGQLTLPVPPIPQAP